MKRRDPAGDDAGAGQPQRFAQDHRDDAARPRADRDPDRHLAPPHRDGMGERRVEAHGADAQRQRAEEAEQRRAQPPRTHLPIEQLRVRPDADERHVRAAADDDPADAGATAAASRSTRSSRPHAPRSGLGMNGGTGTCENGTKYCIRRSSLPAGTSER